MNIHISETRDQLARAASERAAAALHYAIETQGHARFIAATGNSQLGFLSNLVKEPGIEWQKTVMFHLDEYIGISDTHPASFVRYLREQLTGRVPIGTAYFLPGGAPETQEQIHAVSAAIAAAPIDVAFVGIGENGHLAFNDPPADFTTDEPFIEVELDRTCRTQQVSEGWFPDLNAVPTRALTMSIRQIMKSKQIICSVPDQRKAIAVRDCLSDDAVVSPERPASILRTHGNCHVFLDAESSALLTS